MPENIDKTASEFSARVSVLILAGGKGLRMGADIPKQFLELDGMTIIERTLMAFAECSFIDRAVLVVPAAEKQLFEESICLNQYRLKVDIIKGGTQRQESAYLGLRFLSDKEDRGDVVLIHDAVRPFIQKDMIRKVSAASLKQGAAITAVKSVSTLIKSKQGLIESVLNRDEIFEVQTPQGFLFNKIYELHKLAYQQGRNDATDDAQLFVREGLLVAVVEGSYDNIKITSPKDLDLGKKILARLGKL